MPERGGIDNLRLYTAQELDDIFDSMSMDIKRYLLRGGTSIISKKDRKSVLETQNRICK